MGTTTDLLGKFACTRCGHDQYEHNLIVGCPHCKCSATPGEAGNESHFPGTDRPYRGHRVLKQGEFLHEWQRPEPEEPKAALPTKTRYHVGEHYEGREPRVRDWDPFPSKAAVDGEVEMFNQEEAELARMERREVRTRYFAVKATTTYEEV